MIDDIRKRLYATPFVPFTIYVADGREYHVPTRDHAHIYISGLHVIVWTNDNQQIVLPLRQLSGVSGQFLEPSEQVN